MDAREADRKRMKLEESPLHRAVWDRAIPWHVFSAPTVGMPADVRAILDASIGIVRRRRNAGVLYDARGFVSDDTIAELARAGYWGLRVEPRYGGAGASFAMLTQVITEMMVVDPWVAGMASTQAGLGPVTLLMDVGTPEQKARLLPPLASGERLGAFAVTEPGTSSDWNKMTTTARRDGDRLLITGEKLFITNAAPGRTIALLCHLEGRLEMVIVELPWREDDHFQIVEYNLRAPSHLRNVGLRFRDLSVPAANLLVPRSGDGRSIGYRALNYGRVAVCAFAAGMMRRMAGTLIPWVQKRETFGATIDRRELVQQRLGKLAARIVACDALTRWAATLLDEGYRGELECVTAKVFGSEKLEEATLDILLKTYGARSFLAGSLFGDYVHDLIAPTIYEGENEILSLGLMAKLERAHATQYLAPISDAVRSAGFERPDLGDARQLWAARRPLASYVGWLAERRVRQLGKAHHDVPHDARALEALAGDVLHAAALEISQLLRRPHAADRQAVAFELSNRVQNASALIVISRYAASHEDPLVRTAGLCMAMELAQQLLGLRPSGRYHRLVTELGADVASGKFALVSAAEREPIPMADRLPSRQPEGPTRIAGG